MERCRNGCSAVPEDMWPYCCETHRTCCSEFAESCVHDCLPRVHTGDVSSVEERPGLCCALYNLCCFRETLRISSNRNKKEDPVDFPIFHRFHVNPLQGQETPISMPGLKTRTQASSRQLSQASRGNPSGSRGSERREPEKKSGIRPASFERPQLPKKSSNRPRLPERPQLLKKPFTGSGNRDRPAEIITSRLAPTEETRTEADERDRPQEATKATENQDEGEGGAAGPNKPKGGPRLSSLFSARKETDIPGQSGAQEEGEVKAEVDGPTEETQKIESGPVAVARAEKRKSIVRGPSTVSSTLDRNDRRRPGNSPQPKVTRKRLRGSSAIDQQEARRETIGRTQRGQERRGRQEGAGRQSRPQTTEGRPGRPQGTDRSASRPPVAQKRPQPTEEQRDDLIHVNEESRPQPDEENSSPPDSNAKVQVDVSPSDPSVAEEIASGFPTVAGEKLIEPPEPLEAVGGRSGGRSLVADETFINQPQTAADKVTSHLHVAVEKAIDQSRADMEKVSNDPQVALKQVSDQSQVETVVDQSHQASDLSQVVAADVTEQPQDIMEVVTDQSQMLLEELADVTEMAVKEKIDQAEVAEKSVDEPPVTESRSPSSRSGSRRTERLRTRTQSHTRGKTRDEVPLIRNRSRSSNRFQTRAGTATRERSGARDPSQTRGRSGVRGRSQSSRSRGSA